MDKSFILSHVDHTLLKATASWAEIKELCEEAVTWKTATVCVPPSYVERIKKEFKEKLRICTVIGFPLGYDKTAVKRAAVACAIREGADEIDVVINIGDVKNGDFDKVTAEIAELKEETGEHILKIIIETCYLTEDEIIKLCKCVTDGGADFIKTSTGFGTRGASMDDILLMKQYIGSNVKIKASGGIRTYEDMALYLEVGCERLGTSSAVKAASDY
ncbi:MAG: deoxyribose-phosphate aldolase [Oscillospiraceae bacterium]|nr:deoxyribose-phosphate aldolase [Oscillospiraceae bacterium]